MINTARQPLVRAPRLLAPLIRYCCPASSFPAPEHLRAMARPIRLPPVAAPAATMPITRSLSRATASTPVRPLAGMVQQPASINRSFSSAKRLVTPMPETMTKQTSAPREKLEPAQETAKLTRSGSTLIYLEPGFYVVSRVKDHTVLSVLYSRSFVTDDLNIALNAEELSMISRGKATFESIAAKIQSSPDAYRARNIIDFD